MWKEPFSSEVGSGVKCGVQGRSQLEERGRWVRKVVAEACIACNLGL